MKRFLAIIVFLFILTGSALSNSAPTYMPGTPGFAVSVDESCPIQVIHEDLVFDFSESISDIFFLEGKVNASYVMKNPTDKAFSATMTFPVISCINEPDILSITSDGISIPFDMFYGNNADLYNLDVLDIAAILPQLITECPDQPEDGTVYTFYPTGNFEGLDKVYLTVSFPFDSFVCYSGSNGYSFLDDGFVRFSGVFFPNSTGSPSPFCIYIPGSYSPKFEVNIFESYDSTEGMENCSCEISKQPSSFREYLLNTLSSSKNEFDFSDGFYWNYLTALNKCIERGNSVIGVDSLYSQISDRHISAAVYTVDFAPHETKNVCVNCNIIGSVERKSSFSPYGTTSTFTYISNPAKTWKSFGTLDISVKVPDNLPEMSFSVPDFEKQPDGNYFAALESLPDSNISFVFGSPDEKAPASYIFKNLFSIIQSVLYSLGIFSIKYFIIPIAVVCVMLYICLKLLRRFRDKKHKL